jgi:hypothetical protein
LRPLVRRVGRGQPRKAEEHRGQDEKSGELDLNGVRWLVMRGSTVVISGVY